MLVGTRAADCILGLGGDDHIVGLGGRDVLDGGDGDDILEGGRGSDVVYGGPGNDQLAGGEAADRLSGGLANDIVLGGPSDDRIFGGPGNDVLLGEGGFDLLMGGDGDDVILGEPDGAGIFGGLGEDSCEGTDCENPPVPVETGCEPPPPGEVCQSSVCCTELGVETACIDDMECDDQEPCTVESCQPALGCRRSVDPSCVACPIAWQPSALAPVFYGHRDYGTADGAPGPMRVFFPSLDGSPSSANILLGCGRYPLILMAHGYCPEEAHYLDWFNVPAALARSGYVVVVPELTNLSAGVYPWTDPHPDLQRIADTLAWMRSGWDLAGILLPGSIGLVGHSYGSLLSARFAQESVGTENAVGAYASLSGVWAEWPSVPPRPIDSLTIPKLFLWGTGASETSAMMEPGLWPSVPTPKHRAVFTDAEHWDYLRPGAVSCDQPFGRGPCPYTETLAREIVFTFFGKYLPPEQWPSLASSLPDSLLLPPLSLTPEQEFYAGLHRNGVNLFQGSTECSAGLRWEASSTGTTTVP